MKTCDIQGFSGTLNFFSDSTVLKVFLGRGSV